VKIAPLKLIWGSLSWSRPWLEASIITLSIFFFFKNCKYLWIEIVSGEVSPVLIILFLYLTPKVPTEATEILFKDNIW